MTILDKYNYHLIELDVQMLNELIDRDRRFTVDGSTDYNMNEEEVEDECTDLEF